MTSSNIEQARLALDDLAREAVGKGCSSHWVYGQVRVIHNAYKCWYDAVTDACVVSGELPWDENDPYGTVAKLIDHNISIALDPRVSDRAPPSNSESVDTPDLRKLEAAYAKTIFDFTDDPSKSNGESMATARNVFVAHIDSLIASVRKDALEEAALRLEAQHTWLTNVAAANIVRTLTSSKKGSKL